MKKRPACRRRPLLEVLRDLEPESDREDLLARILCGEVRVSGARVRDPRFPADGSEVSLERRRFASRGGLKLDGALAAHGPLVEGLCLLDAGCSTGGFTDCLLERGASRVIAVDVGYGQLDYRLRRDPRVTLLERTNILSLTVENLPALPQGAVADLSFRSLRRAAAHLLALTSERWLVALVKPQFEWRSPGADFRGVVRDPQVRRRVLSSLAGDLSEEGVFVQRVAAASPAGARGNREYFFWLSTQPGLLEPERLSEELDRLPLE
jgi:23S rRNA (cytidine1920-2'-O)/16S rRNA (cytidine1409-2'-O)-methyltransferase